MLAIGSALRLVSPADAKAAEVNLDYVAQLALERAQKPFHSPPADLPTVLRGPELPQQIDRTRAGQRSAMICATMPPME